MERRLLISFSGGETSAYMTYRLLTSDLPYDRIIVVFANTGQESEATLQFVNNCEKEFFFGTVWVEAVQHHGQRLSAAFRQVTFETAARDGAPFEDMIKKYGIPNQKFKHCTRDLKVNPIEAYLRSQGWENGSYDRAIGIRVDEIDRVSVSAATKRIIYPLVSMWPTTKADINAWWKSQGFRLELKGYQGNCMWCWKKTFRKHLTLISESPEIYDFPREMERKYGHVGAEFKKQTAPDYRRVFFRGNTSTNALFALYEQHKDTFVPAEDDAEFDADLDVGAGCEESCEIYSDEDE